MIQSSLPPEVRTMTLERAQDILRHEPEHPHRGAIEALYSEAVAASDQITGCSLVEGWLRARRPYLVAADTLDMRLR